jgi:RNA polymerase sigma-70 factor (sigma-E family)
VYQDVTATFETFYAGTSARLLRYAYGLTGDMAEAQDLTQEAYARAWQRWTRIQTYDSPESWLRLVVTRLATDRWRWMGLRRGAAKERAASIPPPNEAMLDLIAELKRLPMPQRRALVLHYLLDRSVADIAAETDVSVNTVKTWLSRGRTNLAAQLTELPSLPPAITAAARGRQRKRQNILKTIAAFFTTATAAAAFALFGPVAQPPANPKLVIPYLAEINQAIVTHDEKMAYTFWQQADGEILLSAVILQSGKQAWPAVNFGKHDLGTMTFGSSDTTIHLTMLDPSGSGGFTTSAIDLATGKMLWQRTSETAAMFPRFFRDAVVVSDSGQIALHPRTGKQKWVAPGDANDYPVSADGQRLAQLNTEGLLQVRDPGSGRLLSERTGIAGPLADPPPWTHIIGDFVYSLTENSLSRATLTGTDQLVKLLDLPGHSILDGCGPHLCVALPQALIVLDQVTGQQLWRQELGAGLQARGSANGILVLLDSKKSILYDFHGNDITPAAFTGREATWAGSDHVALIRRITKPTEGAKYLSVSELSVYSLTTQAETSFGEMTLRGNCSGQLSRLVCPVGEGFRIFQY